MRLARDGAGGMGARATREVILALVIVGGGRVRRGGSWRGGSWRGGVLNSEGWEIFE